MCCIKYHACQKNGQNATKEQKLLKKLTAPNKNGEPYLILHYIQFFKSINDDGADVLHSF
jgi:hypothetical protein